VEKGDYEQQLPKVWECFKAQLADPGLEIFDELISALHAFQELRYPDLILSRGMRATINARRMAGTTTGNPARPEPSYEPYLGEADALVDEIFATPSVKPTLLSR
jgi:hypothetical protein